MGSSIIGCSKSRMTVWSDEVDSMLRNKVNSVVEQGNLEVKIANFLKLFN